MPYNFDSCVNRTNSSSSRWDLIKNEFGKDDLLGLRIGDVDFNAPQNIIDALEERLTHPVLGYAYKDPAMFTNLATFYKEHAHFNFTPENMLISPGIIPIIAAAVLAFSNVGDEIIFQTPGYPPLRKAVEGNDRVVLSNPLLYNDTQGFTIDFEALEKSITPKTKLWLFCNPHNPTGKVWSKDEIKRIEEIVLKYNLLIISDEINGFLTFKKDAYTPLAAFSQELAQRTIMATSPSKMFAVTGLVYSFAIVLNETLKKALEKKFEALGTIYYERNTLGIVACNAAYVNENALWITEMMKTVKKNYDFTCEFFKKNLPKIKVAKSDGTFTIWLNFKNLGVSHEKIGEMLIKKAGVVLLSGSEFEAPDFWRMNIGVCHPTLEKALNNLEQTFGNL